MTDITDNEIMQWISVVKGDLPGHPFRGNQWAGGQGGGRHDEAIGHLRTLQQAAAADVGRGVRRNTDALGNRFKAAPYGSTISGHVALQNWRIAGEAKALADKIGGDQTKSVEQHLDEARNQVGQLRQEAVQNSRFDNYDTAQDLKEQAAALQGVIDHVSDKLGIQKSVGETNADDQPLEFYELEKAMHEYADQAEHDDDLTNNHLFGMYSPNRDAS